MRRTFAFAAAVLLIGCNTGPSTPTPPPPTPPPPEVTVAVSGTVRDTINRLVPGARVEVTTGRLAGAFVTTDEAGGFAFPEPVPAFSQIRASKPGYVESVTTLGAAVTMPLVFKLGSPNPPINLTGSFDITFDADPTCTALPDVARKRAYQAFVRYPMLELSGAEFMGGDPPANKIVLNQFEEYATFTMSDPPVWEFIPTTGWVMLSGEALGVVDPNFSQVLMEGEITYCPNFTGISARCAVETVSCRSSRHVMTLKRR